MKNVHLLQTETYPAKLQLDRDYGTLKILDEPCVINGQDFVGANLYITSDEEIKDVRPHKGKWQLEQGQILNKFPNYLTDLSECKLVIMTTDPRLIKDGVQALDDEFLNWFIKNQKREIPIITTIVNNESRFTTNIGFESWRKEEPQQKTLGEAAEEYGSMKMNESDAYDDFMAGGMWQQERSYSEEEVKSILQFFIKDTRGDKPWIDADDEWFEQFKKNSDGNK